MIAPASRSPQRAAAPMQTIPPMLWPTRSGAPTMPAWRATAITSSAQTLAAVLAAPAAVAVPGQVERHDVVLRREQRRDEAPPVRVRRAAVHQHDARASRGRPSAGSGSTRRRRRLRLRPACARARGGTRRALHPSSYFFLSSGSRAASSSASVDHHLALLPGGVVLHLALEHHRAAAVGHRRDHALGPEHLVGRRREHLLGDVDLRRVQRPGADAAHQEGVAELVLAADRVVDRAERAVEGQGAGRRARVDHTPHGVVPEVLLRGEPLGVRVLRVGIGAHEVAGVTAADAGRLHAPRRGEVRGAERHALHARRRAPRSPRRWPRRGRSRGSRARAAACAGPPSPRAARAAGPRSGCPRAPRPSGP